MAGGYGFGVPVLEVAVSGRRESIFDRVNVESPDWGEAWHRDWQAERHAATPRVQRNGLSATSLWGTLLIAAPSRWIYQEIGLIYQDRQTKRSHLSGYGAGSSCRPARVRSPPK